ncbi:MAG TPA: hypothetical protein VKC57_04440 [Ktedonobacterales bacterium]|nr:hypothetical protein [Ktedonobacterales bacterium]
MPAVFRIEFRAEAEQAIKDNVPTDIVIRVVDMLRAIGETALEIEAGPDPQLGRERLTLSLKTDGFVFHYTLDLRARLITVFSVVSSVHAVG